MKFLEIEYNHYDFRNSKVVNKTARINTEHIEKIDDDRKEIRMVSGMGYEFTDSSYTALASYIIQR